MTVICVTIVAAVEIWTEVKDRDNVLVAEMFVAYSLIVESLPSSSVSRDWACLIKACKAEIMVSAEVMANLLVLASALASAEDIDEALLLTISNLCFAW